MPSEIPHTAELYLSNIYWLIAFVCGCIAAIAELFSRYTDGPFKTLQHKESYLYLSLNGLFSVVAFIIIEKSGISFEPFGKSPIGQAVLAGISSMVILRSSVANIKRGETTVHVGLAPLMQIFLDTADRAFDRKRSEAELKTVTKIMKTVDFNKAVKDLPTTCLNLMQNIGEDEGKRMGNAVAKLAKGDVTPLAKAINLGVIISKVTGPDLLQLAVESLGDAILISGAAGEQQSLTYEEERIKELKKKVLVNKSSS